MYFIFILLLVFILAFLSILLLCKLGKLDKFSKKLIPIAICLAVAFGILILSDIDQLSKMISVFFILVYLYFVIRLCKCNDCQKVLPDLKIVICIFGGMCFLLYFSR